MKVKLIVNSDFGDWEGIEDFDWNMYRQELEMIVKRYYPSAREVDVEFGNDSSVLIDGEQPMNPRVLHDILDAVDATEERFYKHD